MASPPPMLSCMVMHREFRDIAIAQYILPTQCNLVRGRLINRNHGGPIGGEHKLLRTKVHRKQLGLVIHALTTVKLAELDWYHNFH